MVVALGPGGFYGRSLPRPRSHSNVKLSADVKRVDPPVGVLDPLLAWAQEAHRSMGGLSFDRHRLQGRIEVSLKLLRAQEERKEKETKKRKRDERSVGVGSVAEGGSGHRRLSKTTAPAVVPDVDELPLPDDEEEAEMEFETDAGEEASEDSPTPAPAARVTRSGVARRKLLRRALLDLDSDEENVPESGKATPLSPTASKTPPSPAAAECVSGTSPRLTKKRARKLGEEFDRVAAADSPAPVLAASTAAAASASMRSEKKTPAKDKGKAVAAPSPRRNSPRVLPAEGSRRLRLSAA